MKKKPTQPKTAPKFESALKVAGLDHFLRQLEPDLLPNVTHTARKHLYWAIGDPTESKIREIESDCPILQQVIDFDLVVRRLEILDRFERSSFGVSLSKFFPELDSVCKAAAEVIFDQPKSIHKTEYWLEPIAREAGADADIEATIYFASRGRTNLVEPSTLRDLWHRAICYTITRGGPAGRVPKDVFARAKDCTISLSEAADILEFNGDPPCFFSFRDEEEDFIDAAFFRAVEWLNVTGFDRWLRSSIKGLSTGPQYGIEHGAAGWSLFHWCRSSLALRMAERNGLEAWLWALINGPHERDKPWRCFSSLPGEAAKYQNYVPLAGIIPFVWNRIQPTHMKDDVVVAANKLLFECQTHAGGWPIYSDGSKPCLLATCAAIHGLALSTPRGWEHAASRGADWLLAQQEDGGHWEIAGGPTVMLSVLVLDSISLGKRSTQNTFQSNPRVDSAGKAVRAPSFEYSQEQWFLAALPKTQPVTLKKAKRRFHPTLGIVVATQTELKAAIKQLRPSKGLSTLWQVSHGNDTFYLGRFGTFESALMLCSMGTQGATGSTLSCDALLRIWHPKAIVMAGIAFGADRGKQKPGDILVAQHIIPYEAQRQGVPIQFRNPVPPASDGLLNRFKNVLDWEFSRPDGTRCKIHYGPVLSGDKLIDSESFKQTLLENYPTAIGGEMEGAGLWASAVRNKTEWLLVKGVCDWADGKKNDDYQELAAAASVDLCKHVFQNPHALAGL